jgi:hypothetical protein
MPDINLSPYTAESEAIARKLRMAQLLSQQANEPMAVPTQAGVRASHFAGLAKMLDAYTAGQKEKEATQEAKDLQAKYQADTSGDYQNLIKAIKAPAIAGSPERTPQLDVQETQQMADQGTPMPPNIPAITKREAGELTPEGFASMKTPTGQQQYMAQLLAQAVPKEGAVLPEGASYITKAGKVLIQGTGKEDYHVPKNEFDPLTGQTLTVAYSNKGNRKVIDTKGAYTPDQWNSIPVAERAKMVFDQYKFGNVSATDLMQAGQRNVSLGQELAKLGFDIGPSAAGGGVRLPVNAPMPNIPANGIQPNTSANAPVGAPTPTVTPNVAPNAQQRPYTRFNAVPPQGNVPPAQPTNVLPAQPTASKPIIDQVTPKEKQILLVAQPQARTSAETSLQNIDRLINVSKELQDHPGLPNIVGKVNQFSLFDTSKEATGARALQSTLVKQAAVSALQSMREASKTGGAVGAVTEGEWPILEQQLAALDKAQSSGDYKTALTNLQNQLHSSAKRIKSAYESTYGILDYSAPEYKRQETNTGSTQKGSWKVVK